MTSSRPFRPGVGSALGGADHASSAAALRSGLRRQDRVVNGQFDGRRDARHPSVIGRRRGGDALAGMEGGHGVPEGVRSVVPEHAVRLHHPAHGVVAAEGRGMQRPPGVGGQQRGLVAMGRQIENEVLQGHVDPPRRAEDGRVVRRTGSREGAQHAVGRRRVAGRLARPLDISETLFCETAREER